MHVHGLAVRLRGVAQLVARMVWDHEVRGSSPRTPTAISSQAGVTQSGRVPAFQAGCRGFESRLPLFSLNRLFTGSPEAASWQASGDAVSKQAVL